jgi:hypothetical protein
MHVKQKKKQFNIELDANGVYLQYCLKVRH